MRILFVCLGNICRSPTAEAAFREAADDAGLEVEVDSAGTGDWHIGEPPDRRMQSAALEDGLQLAGRARQVEPVDFERYDLLVAMDRENRRDLERLAPDPEAADKIRLFREFQPDADAPDVPDPYYGGDDGFHEVVRIVRSAAKGLVDELRQR
ncbi:MAG: low molecular weight protein-tyrosine-phosphatase [Nitriliruptorales bacterium]|nr:low molecular weight protein-tyrosine-phosphatase [Nitriliruptorales bacterium]